MMRGALTIGSFISALFFPWPLTMLLALAAAFFEPLVPLAAGLFADTLYYAPHVHAFPVFTAWSMLVTVVAIVVRSRLSV